MMEKICLRISIVLILIFTSCKISVGETSKANPSLIIEKVKKQKGTNKKRIDTLPLEKVKFNTKSLFLDYSQITKENDSIRIVEWECGNPFNWEGEKFEHVYKEEEEYVTNEKKVVLLRAPFILNNKLEFKIDDKEITFTKDTEIEKFKSLFPNSEISDYTNEGKGYICYVSFNTDVTENSWMFYFDKNKKLEKFELYWWLC